MNIKHKIEIEECPECGMGITVINGKFVRHEKGLCYVPYDFYRKIERVHGTSVKEQAKRNLCRGSGKKFIFKKVIQK